MNINFLVIYSKKDQPTLEVKTYPNVMLSEGEFHITIPKNHKVSLPIVNHVNCGFDFLFYSIPINDKWEESGLNSNPYQGINPPNIFIRSGIYEKHYESEKILLDEKTATISFINYETLRKKNQRLSRIQKPRAYVRHSNTIIDSNTRSVIPAFEDWFQKNKKLGLVHFISQETGLFDNIVEVRCIKEVSDLIGISQSIHSLFSFPLLRDAVAYYLDGYLHGDINSTSKIKIGKMVWKDSKGNMTRQEIKYAITCSSRAWYKAAGLNSENEWARKVFYQELRNLIESPPVIPIFRYEKEILRVEFDLALKVCFSRDGNITIELPGDLYNSMILPKPKNTLGYCTLPLQLNSKIISACQQLGIEFHYCFDRLLIFLEKEGKAGYRGELIKLKFRVFATDQLGLTTWKPYRIKKYLEKAVKITNLLMNQGVLSWKLCNFLLSRSSYVLTITNLDETLNNVI